MSSNQLFTELSQSLLILLPSEYSSIVPKISQVIVEAVTGSMGAAKQQLQQLVKDEPKLRDFLRLLAGEHISVNNSTISFGEDSQFGDITIRDVAGGNLIKNNITIKISTDLVTDHKYWLLGLCAVAYAPLTIDDLMGLEPLIFERIEDLRVALQGLSTIGGDGSTEKGFAFISPNVRDEYRRKRLIGERALVFHEKFVDWGRSSLSFFANKYPSYLCRYWIAHLAATTKWRNNWPYISSILTALEINNPIIKESAQQRYIQQWAQIHYATEGSYEGYLSDLDILWRYSLQSLDAPLLLRCALLKSSFNYQSFSKSYQMLNSEAELIFVGNSIRYLPPYKQSVLAERVMRDAYIIKDPWEKVTCQAENLQFLEGETEWIALRIQNDTRKARCADCRDALFKCTQCKIATREVQNLIKPYISKKDNFNSKVLSWLKQVRPKRLSFRVIWVVLFCASWIGLLVIRGCRYVKQTTQDVISRIFWKDKWSDMNYENGQSTEYNDFEDESVSRAINHYPPFTWGDSIYDAKIFADNAEQHIEQYLFGALWVHDIISTMKRCSMTVWDQRKAFKVCHYFNARRVDRIARDVVSSQSNDKDIMLLARLLNNLPPNSVNVTSKVANFSYLNIDNYIDRTLLISLVKHLPEGDAGLIIDQFLCIYDERDRLSALIEIAEYMPASRIEKIFENICSSKDLQLRLKAIQALVLPLSNYSWHSFYDARKLWCQMLIVLSRYQRPELLMSINALHPWIAETMDVNEFESTLDYVSKIANFYPL